MNGKGLNLPISQNKREARPAWEIRQDVLPVFYAFRGYFDEENEDVLPKGKDFRGRF